MSMARTILAQVEHYLTSRRTMGFDLRGEGYQLHAFARFAEQHRQDFAPRGRSADRS